MALIAAPRYCHDTRQYALRFLSFDGFGSLMLFCFLMFLFWAFMPEGSRRSRPASRVVEFKTSIVRARYYCVSGCAILSLPATKKAAGRINLNWGQTPIPLI